MDKTTIEKIPIGVIGKNNCGKTTFINKATTRCPAWIYHEIITTDNMIDISNDFAGIYIIVSAICPDSLNEAINWRNSISTIFHCPIILLVNKIDLCANIFDGTKYQQICKLENFDTWFPVSTKTGTNMDMIIKAMQTRISAKQDYFSGIDDMEKYLACTFKKLDVCLDNYFNGPI